MPFKLVVKRLHLAHRQIALKKTPDDRVRPFRTMKRCEPNSLELGEQAPSRRGVLVRYIECDEET